MSGPEAPPSHLQGFLGGRKSRLRHLWLVGVGLYIAILWYIGWQRIGAAFASMNPWLLAAQVATMSTAMWLRALKWRLVLGPGQDAVGLHFLSKVGAGFSPGRVGELAPLLLRRHRTPRMGAWIVVDRLLETAATLGFGLVGLIALQMPKRGIAVTFGVAVVVFVIAPFYVLRQRTWFLWLAARFRPESVPHRTFMLIAAMSDEIRRLGVQLPMASALTALCTCLDLVTAILLYLSFGYRVSFAVLATVQCAHGIASAVPFLPNATGVPYLVAAGLLHQLAGVPEAVLAAGVGVSLSLSNILLWTSFGLVAAKLRTPEAEITRSKGQGAVFDRLTTTSDLFLYEEGHLDRINALVPEKGLVLDVGCGDGAVGAALDGVRVVGFDISQQCARAAGGRGLNALVADATTALPFLDARFDTVYCVDVLHHLHGVWEPLLRELVRVLKPGGTLAIVEPDARYAYVRWTQAPRSPIRVAPCDNEPAIYPDDLMAILKRLGLEFELSPIRVIAHQVNRDVFPMWQRLLKAPFIVLITLWQGERPNKFAITARAPGNRRGDE